MKLLELIVENVNRADIPEYMTYIMQDMDGEIKYTDSCIKPAFGGYAWIREGDNKGDYFSRFYVSEDASTTIITREELMRAYNLVEQGYTLWFGGDCPLEYAVGVEVWLRGYSNTTLHLAGNLIWEHYSIEEDIVAYKLVEQSTVEEKSSLPTYYCEDNLQNTILDVWASQSGDLCINLTSLGVNNEIVMSPITALQFANDLSALAIKIMEKEND